MALSSVASDEELVSSTVEGFEVGYIAEDGGQHWVPLLEAWAVRFEAMAPARQFNAREGQRHLPHDSLRDPCVPRGMLSPNDKYASLVAAAGYLPGPPRRLALADYRRSQACCRELEQRYGLRRIAGRRSAERYPTPAKLNKATRQNRDELPRDRLRRMVHAAAEAGGEQGFLDHLRASANQLIGYAIALPDDRNAARDTIWNSGSTLAADLSLPQLRRRWRSP